MNLFDMFESEKKQDIEEACWKGYHKEGMKTMFGKRYPNCVKNKNESLETYVNKGECPGCGGAMVSEEQINEKQDACYHKVKSRYKVWPSAYASGALVQCRKKGAANWGNKNESITQEEYDQLDENLKQWFSDKWVRFGPDGKIRGDCARGDSSEGKPKCLPQSKAHALGKKGRASAAARKRREDPNPERSGKAINVNTKKKSNEGVAEGNDDHIWGPQGNFAGDRIVNLGGVTMKTVEVGDTVKYFGQKAKVVAMSKDRKHSRINILSDFGGTTRDVLTSDLKQLGQGVAEGYEPGDKITWYHSNHHPEIEGTVVGWKDGHLIVKSIDPQPRNTEKTVAKYRVPKNNILSHDKQGVAEEKIQEIQRKPDDPVGYSTDNRIVKSSDLKGLKMIPGSNRLGYSFGPMVTAFTGATHGIHLYDIKNRRLVGYLALAKSAFPLPKSYRVANVNIDDDYRGQGLGQTLYGIAIKLLGLTIEADDTQTAASRRMWVALSQIPGVEINGYAKIWADEWDKRDTPNEIYDDSELRVIRALIKAGGEELGRSHSSVYVSFPVGSNADKSELQSIQKGLAIYSRLHPEDGGTDNGLYARWGGQVREQGVAEGSNKKQEATRRIQKMLNDKFGANLDVDGVLGPLTLKSINKFMPNAKVGPAKDPNKTTAVQGKKIKNEDTDQEKLAEKWSQKYKSSINCSNPKGFSQRAHCDGKKKNEDILETSEYNHSNINDDDWYEFDSEGNVVRQSGPKRYELPFGSNKTIKLPNGNIAAKGMTAKRLKLFKNLSESREYYTVMCTDAKSLRQDFNMSKDRHGWFLKEGSTSKQKLDVYRAFGSPKLKEYDLSAFSGGTQTKGEDNVISPVGSQTRAQYKK